MEGKDVVIRGDKELALYDLETSFAVAVRQRELLEIYIKRQLMPDKHFYTVGDDPGRKPSLTKEGAELICLPHGLKGRYQWLSGPDNPPLDITPYQITMKCELEADGRFKGEGVGSASSHITTRAGEHKPRQKDPGLCHNATLKMACKSAYIAATLNSTAASEFFTQDLEDDHTGSDKKEVDKTQHWCKEHDTSFFMKGRMKAYAHPIGDTGQWCHEHNEKPPDKRGEFTKEGRDLVEEAIVNTKKPQEAPAEPPQDVLQQSEEEVKREVSDEPQNTIDMGVLSDQLAELKKKVPKAWSDANLLSYMKTSYGVIGSTPLEAAAKLDEGRAKHFLNRVKEAIELA